MVGEGRSRDAGPVIGRRIGGLMSTLVVAVLVADAMVELFAPELLRQQMTATGFPPSLAVPLGCVILACATLYAISDTAALGAILVTGFAGGAICTHFRMGEIGSPPQIFSALLGVFAWGGLYLRDERLRALLPFRSSDASRSSGNRPS